MQRLQFVLFQIDEARRHLRQGLVPGLRVALILLDNAVEVLLDRWIEEDLIRGALIQRLQETTRAAGISEAHPDFQGLFAEQLLSAGERRQVARFFDEKVRYVAETKRKIPQSVGSVLSHLHRYRNQAYHSGLVKPETLRTSVMILLDLCCRLLTSLESSLSYGSDEDYTWLEERFTIVPQALVNNERLEEIAAELREGVPIDEGSLRETLARNLDVRLSEEFKQLDFIASFIKMNPADALLEAQRFALEELKQSPPYHTAPKRLDEAVSVAQLHGMQAVSGRVRAARNSVEAFRLYAECDVLLERIEYMTGRLAGEIDCYIQFEVDVALGK
ncbi:MAG: hypothetical protein AB1700_18000 [Bacillota bacterium]